MSKQGEANSRPKNYAVRNFFLPNVGAILLFFVLFRLREMIFSSEVLASLVIWCVQGTKKK